MSVMYRFMDRQEARERASKMRLTGWPDATALCFIVPKDIHPSERRWVVRAVKRPEKYLRVNGFVE